MSYINAKEVNAVLEHSSAKDTGLMIMIAIAKHTNQDGFCYPDIPTIAPIARTSERTVKGYVSGEPGRGSLPGDEILVIPGRGRGNTHRYVILVGCDDDEKRRRLESALQQFDEHDPRRDVVLDRLIDYTRKGDGTSPFTHSHDTTEKVTAMSPIDETTKGDIGTKKVTAWHVKGDTVAIKGDIVVDEPSPETAPSSPEVAESESLIIQEEYNESNKEESKAASRPTSAFEAFVKLCHEVPSSCLTKRERSAVGTGLNGGKDQKPLPLRLIQGKDGPLTPTITAEMIDTDFRFWWYCISWRGKNGDRPTPHQPRDCWREFVSWLKQGRPRMERIISQLPDWYELSESDPAGLARQSRELDGARPQRSHLGLQDMPAPPATSIKITDRSVVDAAFAAMRQRRMEKTHGTAN